MEGFWSEIFRVEFFVYFLFINELGVLTRKDGNRDK